MHYRQNDQHRIQAVVIVYSLYGTAKILCLCSNVFYSVAASLPRLKEIIYR